MRVVVAGAGGVIGRELLPLLRIDGRSVVAVCRSRDRAAALEADGYTTVIADALDADALHRAVVGAAPDVIINELTSLPRRLLHPRSAAAATRRTNRLRREAGAALARAADDTGARLIAQSIAFAYRPGSFEPRTEDAPLYLDAPGMHGDVVAAVSELERVTREVNGTVLRYGALYGPGTYFAPGEAYSEMLRRRLLPIVGSGRGIWGLLSVEDAARATVRAIVGPPGTYNVVDDDPVPASELIPWMAAESGARPPRRLPRALFGLGPSVVLRYLIDEQPPVSNDLARSRLGWQPAHPSWRAPLSQLLAGGTAGG